MWEVYSPHWWTFSEWVPSISFIENKECFSECPSCNWKRYKSNYCFDCWEWYSNKEKIFQIILEQWEDDIIEMTPEERKAERDYINESRTKERRSY